MSDRPEARLAGLDGPRPLPASLAGRLEAGLTGATLRAELKEALADALTGDDSLFAGLDGPRPVPSSTRSALESRLVRSRRSWSRVTLLAGLAAACLLAAVIGVATLGRGSHPKPVTARGEPTSGTVPAPANSHGSPDLAAGATGSGVSATGDSSGYARPTVDMPPGGATVTSVTPSTGPDSGGTLVVVMGSGLAGATAVDFGGVPAVQFTVVSDGVIDAKVPAHRAGTVTVVVESGAQASGSGPGDRFTYTG